MVIQKLYKGGFVYLWSTYARVTISTSSCSLSSADTHLARTWLLGNVCEDEVRKSGRGRKLEGC
jgi:hypothetical protein